MSQKQFNICTCEETQNSHGLRGEGKCLKPECYCEKYVFSRTEQREYEE